MAAYPEDVGVYVDLASMARSGSESMFWWRRCVERAPAVAACPAVIAGLLMNYGEYAEAEGWLDLASTIDDSSGWIWIMRFFLHQRLNQPDQMEQAALKAMEYGSRASGAEFLYVHRHLRWLLTRAPERVRAYYERHYPLLLQDDPQVNPRTYAAAISLAFLLIEQGQKVKADELLDRSLLVVESTPEDWYLTDRLLGFDARTMIHVLKGQHELALATMRRQIEEGVAWNWQVLEEEPIYQSLGQFREFEILLATLRSGNSVALEMARIRDMERNGAIVPLSTFVPQRLP